MLTSFLFFLSWGVSITHPVLAFTCGEFLLHIPCWLYIYLGSFSCTSRSGFIFIWGVSLTHPKLALIFCGEFLTPPMLALKKMYFWGVSLTHPMLASFLCGEFRRLIPCWLYFYLGSFSYTSHSCFIFSVGRGGWAELLYWGVSLTHPMLGLFVFCLFVFKSREFLLPIPCWLRFYAGSFSYTSRTGFF